MPLNLLVVDTASVSVKLRLDPVDGNGVSIADGDKNHVKYKVYIDRVDFTAFSNLGTAAQFVYHRLAITLPASAADDFARPSTVQLPEETNTSLMPPPLPAVLDLRRYVALYPGTEHGNTKYVEANGFKSFKLPNITFTAAGSNGVTGTNTFLGTITRKFGSVQKTFKFDLQYQYDAMPLGVPSGPVPNGDWEATPSGNQNPTAGTWVEYQQVTDDKIVVTGSDNLSYKLRIYHVDRSNYDPNPSANDEPIPRLWYAGNNLASLGGVINPSAPTITTLNIGGVTYTPSPATIAETWLVNLLWKAPNQVFEGDVNNAIDYVLEIPDGTALGSTEVDDTVTVTAAAYSRRSIGSHLLFRQGGQVGDSVSANGGTLKLFRGRRTRIYTDLVAWSHVTMHSFDLKDDDDDVTLSRITGNDVTFQSLHGSQFFGWTRFDIDQTTIGVGKTVDGTVYLDVMLGPNSTGVSFDHLYITHDVSTQNPISGFPITF